ncbi:MAG: glycosyl hydrolase family 38, partial [Isosphaeraceae bacterium]|nr:glycosyl hydrolase family 38 [Isosphaeraceae bacterium]
LETLTRPPLAADRPAQGLHLPWRLARSMKDDHVATVPLVHWPDQVAPWYLDLRRVAAYSPVLARWVTLNDYFHLTDRPFEMFRPDLDPYITPYLAQAVARRDSAPISRRAEHARLRARLDALSWLHAVARVLAGPAGTIPNGPLPEEEKKPEPATEYEEYVADYPPLPEQERAEVRGPAYAPLLQIEETLETGRLADARAALEGEEGTWIAACARALLDTATLDRPGYLVLNPLGVPRRAAVLLPEAAPDLRLEGPLRVAQFTDEGVWAVVELPAFGFAWVPRASSPNAAAPPIGVLSARGRPLKNETIELEIDEATGGLRSLRAAGEPTARLGQQLVMTGLVAPDGKPASSKMRAEQIEVEYGGPALVQAESRGVLIDPLDQRPLARFRQRYRLWSGRPVLEIDITLSDLDAFWLDRAAGADPWEHFLSCRWAWPDPNTMLRRTSLLGPHLTEADRPETPDVIDLSTRRQRTALLFGGLAHHRRHGPRMLDTLLVAGHEVGRHFHVGVALDLEHPFPAALDLISPPLVLPTEFGPPHTGPVGWLFHLDSKAVAVTRVEANEPSGGDGEPGLTFHLIETAGLATRGRLRLFRNPSWARQTDFQGEVIADLPIEGDAVLLDLTPYE